jgi:trimeric autotransporter adhesin
VPSFTGTNTGIADISGTVTVSGSLDGCAAQPVSFTLTVSEAPVMDPVGNSIFCNGTSVPASNLGSNVPGTTFIWSNSNTAIGAPASGTNDLQSFTATNGGTNSITGTFTVTPWSGTCAGQPESFSITVSPTPTLLPMNNVTQCAGQNIPAVVPGSSVSQTSFSWTNSDTSIGLAGSGTSSTSPFVCVNNTAYPVTSTVTVTPEAGGCTGPSGAMTITVNPMPAAVASNTGPYCLMEDATFSAGSFPSATYSWSGPNGFSSGDQNPSISDVTGVNEGAYIVTVSANGCTSTATTNLAITPGVPVAIAPAGPFCANEPVVLMSVNDTGGTWSGTGITNPVTGAFDPAAAGTGDLMVTYTPEPGCMIANSTIVTVNMMPIVQFAGDDLSFCAGDTITLTDLTVPANGDLTWDFGNGETSNANGSVSHIYESQGLYTIMLTSSVNGCSSTSAVNDYVEVLPHAIASFDVLPSTETTTTDPVFTFRNNSSNATDYTWDFGDLSGSNDEDPVHTYAETGGSYTVTLYANNEGNCPDSAKRTVSVVEDLIFFVPNAFTPDGDEHNNVFLPVFDSGYDPYSYTLYIFNRWGEILFESHNTDIGWDGTYSNLLAKEGVYTWAIDFKLKNLDKRVQYHGSVTLIR